jgi:hypothetical protein
MRLQLAASILLFVQLAAAAGQSAKPRLISAQRVADALDSAGLTVKAEQIEFLSEVSVSSNPSTLQVVSTTSNGSTEVVRLRCRDNHECLPFYVLVHGSAGVRTTQRRQESGATAESTVFPAVIRGGDRAVLILENADYRIRVPVICLQDGARGQKIRVASKDRKRFFEGEVVSAGLLKGSL